MIADDTLLTHFEEGELKGELKAKQKIAQKLIGMGLKIEQIASATDLDLSTVESLYAKQAQAAAI